MRSHSAIRTALKSFIVGATGLPATSVFWHARSRNAHEDYCILRIAGLAVSGIDSVVQSVEEVEQEDVLTLHQCGNRKFTLIASFFSYRPTDDYDAIAYSQNVIKNTKKFAATFKAANIGFRGVLSQVDISEFYDGREVSAHEIQLGFHADESSVIGESSYVETFGVKSNKLYNFDGSIASDQIDMEVP